MATLDVRRFSKPEVLRRIGRRHLLAFLAPHEAYFKTRGVELPPVHAEDGLNYGELSHILLTPDSSTPPDLAEALFYVNELSTPDGFDAIQEAIAGSELDVAISENAAFADLAVQVWNKAPEVIEKAHAEQRLWSRKTFEYFKTGADPVPPFVQPTEETLAALGADLDEWFAKKRRGKYTKVHVVPRADYVMFIVRHGKPYTRESVIDKGESASQYFRPERYDVVVYNPSIGEIRINAETKGERELYRTRFGLHVFGDPDFFKGRSRFDLEPLRRTGEDSLLCDDIEGIESIRLKEIQIFYGGTQKDYDIRRSEDFFASLRERERAFPAGGKLTRAKFLIKFADSKTPRTITLSSGNRAQFKRDDDGEIIEKWLGKRGFIVGNGDGENG
jgi:hypothetical protein